MFKWKIDIEKKQGKYRPQITISVWLDGKFNYEEDFEYTNPFNINRHFSLPILRLPKWNKKSNSDGASQYQRYPKLPFMLWESKNPDSDYVPCIKENNTAYYNIIGGNEIDIFTSSPHIIACYYLDWTPNATLETYEPVIQAFIEHWITPLQQEYERRLIEAISSQAIKITKTNDNNNKIKN